MGTSRDPLECEIERLVQAGDLPGILKWLAFLEEEKKQGLPVREILKNKNAKGQSLLHVALACENPNLEICQFLFEQLKEDEILLSDDEEGRSLIWFAARSNLPELAIMLIQYQSTALPFLETDQKQKESWLRASKFGVTPLHLAARNPKSDLLTYLIEHGDIHAVDKNGRTPLFHAAHGDQYDNAALLINHGSDMYVSDNEGKTFFYYFEKFPIAEKIKLFKQLANEHQLMILQYYRNKLADKRQVDEKKQVERDETYSILMAQRVAAPGSLQALILSKIPYEAEAEFPEIPGFTDEMLQVVPTYRERMLKTPLPKSRNQILDEDRETVRLLLEKTEMYLVNLSERQKPPINWKTGIGYFFGFSLVTLGWIAICIGFTGVFGMIIGAWLFPSMIAAAFAFVASLLVVSLDVVPLIVGLGALGVTILGSWIASVGLQINTVVSKSRNIQPEEIKELQETLQKEVLDKFVYLPVEQDVTNELVAFAKTKSQAYFSIEEMKEKVGGLKANLEKLLTGLNKSRMPFSPVPAPVVKALPHHPLPKRIKISAPGAQPKEIKISAPGAQPKEIKIPRPERSEGRGISGLREGASHEGEGVADLHSRERSESPLRSNKRRSRTPSPGASAPVLSPRFAPGEDSISGGGRATDRASDRATDRATFFVRVASPLPDTKNVSGLQPRVASSIRRGVTNV